MILMLVVLFVLWNVRAAYLARLAYERQVAQLQAEQAARQALFSLLRRQQQHSLNHQLVTLLRVSPDCRTGDD